MPRVLCTAAMAFLLAAAPTLAPASTWEIDPVHTSASFAVRHLMVSTVRGTMGQVTGRVQLDEQVPTKSSVVATVDATGIDTREAKRDEHLRGPDFLDVAKYPTITFTSKQVEQMAGGHYRVSGDLTLHGVTKPIVLEVDGSPKPIADPLVVACDPRSYEAVLRDRFDIAAALGPLLGAFPGDHVHEPRLLICLYAPEPLHVDLKFVAVDDLVRRVEDPAILWERDGALRAVLARAPARFPDADLQWMEDRFWTWVHYAATRLGRGELFEVINFLSDARAMVLGPLLHRHRGQPPRGVRRLETVTPDHVPALAATVAAYSAESCAAATRATIDLYRRLRHDHATPALVRRSAAEAAAVAYLDRVEARLSR